MRRQMKEVQLLEGRANLLAADAAEAEGVSGGEDAAAAALDKATGVYREERRAYRMLKRQAILGRAERALQMLVRVMLTREGLWRLWLQQECQADTRVEALTGHASPWSDPVMVQPRCRQCIADKSAHRLGLLRVLSQLDNLMHSAGQPPMVQIKTQAVLFWCAQDDVGLPRMSGAGPDGFAFTGFRITLRMQDDAGLPRMVVPDVTSVILLGVRVFIMHGG